MIRSNIKRGGNGNCGLPGPNNSPRPQAIRSSYSKLARRSFMSITLSRPRPAAMQAFSSEVRAPSNTPIGQPEAAAAASAFLERDFLCAFRVCPPYSSGGPEWSA